MEHKFSASVDKVYGLITDLKWLQERSRAMGELKSACKKAKKGSGLTVSMDRTVHRELPALIAKVLNPDSDIVLVEQWEPTEECAAPVAIQPNHQREIATR